MVPKCLVLLAFVACVASEFEGLNLRRQPFDEEATEDMKLGDNVVIARAAAATFPDPQKLSVTGTIPASQPVLVSCEFQNKWTQATHPIDYPDDAHWSPIVLASHSNQYNMWSLGGMASRGVEEVAEVCDY